jgi:hypothetical protein
MNSPRPPLDVGVPGSPQASPRGPAATADRFAPSGSRECSIQGTRAAAALPGPGVGSPNGASTLG